MLGSLWQGHSDRTRVRIRSLEIGTDNDGELMDKGFWWNMNVSSQKDPSLSQLSERVAVLDASRLQEALSLANQLLMCASFGGDGSINISLFWVNITAH